jgi:UMF1 family MFS transporter
MYLQTRPGPPLPSGENYILFSWKKGISPFGNHQRLVYQFFHLVLYTISQFKRLPNTFLFLTAYLIYADGISTVATTAILFGQDVLNLSATESTVMGLIAPLGALIGNYLFLFIQRKLGITTKNMVIALLFICCLVPLYGVLGLFSTTVGYYTIGELYGGTIVYGLTLGAIQSYSRVLFAELIPPGNESEFFSLYEITDKGSSWLGPLLVGITRDVSGSMRPAFVILVILLLLPVPILYRVDVLKGKKEALVYSEALE